MAAIKPKVLEGEGERSHRIRITLTSRSPWWDGTPAPLQVVSACCGWQCTAACGVNTATGQPCNGGTTEDG